MIFNSPEEVIVFIQDNQVAPKWVTDARKYSADLSALVDGEKFIEFLIKRIEKLESLAKAKVRQDYARSIEDLVARLFLPIENVFSSTGGVKDYSNGDAKLSPENNDRLLNFVSNIKDGKSLEIYLKEQWMDLYHTDPAGVIKLTYTSFAPGIAGNYKGVASIYPVYFGINTIRNYTPKGQLVDNIIFEPVKMPDNSQIWTVIDDNMEWSFIQKGKTITLNPEKTFEHPFGEVPIIINSNKTDKYGTRLSPIDKIIPLLCEYGRDQSIKTIFKFLQGFPMTYKMDMLCLTCNGTKKQGTEDCTACGGTGWFNGKTDVTTDFVTQAPDGDTPAIDPKLIAGFISPDLETWKQFNEELDFLERKIELTYWGKSDREKAQNGGPEAKTATQIIYDKQPQINKLMEYSNTTEWIEWKLTEWICNGLDPAKPKDANVSLIVYGNHFILEGVDEILEKYYASKTAGAPVVIKDTIWNELITVKYKYDPTYMAQTIKKSVCEPYLHWSDEECNSFGGQKAVFKKAFFRDWWAALNDAMIAKDGQILKTQFETDFVAFWEKEKPEPPPAAPPIVIVPPDQE